MTIFQVFVRIKGTRGRIPKTRLTKKAGSVKSEKGVAFRFAKGATHIFKVWGPEVGDIKSLTIEVTFELHFIYTFLYLLQHYVFENNFSCIVIILKLYIPLMRQITYFSTGYFNYRRPFRKKIDLCMLAFCIFSSYFFSILTFYTVHA